ncbi:hypothetical protein H072_1842 [Dactylellina haptotyla CBS 200.50]|uniref:Uncharacterized protein n=1 Tax=Dactylellina haptotyla (strain CBS 200.50) TaxID=1284197 RepID=S8AML4_DACHA|nr:hypothetical protein H072_1842 [Dactylellina haptotyla CBS 200.50]
MRNRQDNRKHYEADIPIPDEMAFFERNDHVNFVIYQDFECCGHSNPNLMNTKADDEEHPPHKSNFHFHTRPPVKSLCYMLPESHVNKINRGTFAIISKEFRQLILELQWKAKIPDWNREFKLHNLVDGPHHCIIYNITSIRKCIGTFGPRQQHLLNLLFDHIIDNFGLELQNAIELFAQGRVSKETICYLMRPEGLIVSHDKLNGPQAFVVGTWPSVSSNRLSFMAWSWRFNGVFKKHEQMFEGNLNELFGESNEIDIRKLPYYPLEYADPEDVNLLKQRGICFWSCRYRRIVDYSGWDVEGNEQFDNVRFIIDTMTYRKMHPDSTLAKQPLTDSLGERMKSDTPLEGDLLLVFPPAIYGFHVQERKWFNLKVDNLTEVQWNKEAFDSLVIDESTKLLIVTLVSNKIAADSGTDLMSNKGNGLSTRYWEDSNSRVAEYAEKPLYRVTTGDIGTDPEAVEKYLTSVLYLGKIWGCVVLLDEADVFLEERTLSDLRRNALVSVFLRVLEHYDGIIILTSNRVGTFDSAFKSRIQLAIHYDDLSQAQRIKIWQSFITRLEDIAPDAIDIKELSLEKKIRKLAKHDLNGRQIRNNITTARQLALYKKELMNMSHLETVVQVSQKFESYLRDVKAGLDDNQIAREDGLR